MSLKESLLFFGHDTAKVKHSGPNFSERVRNSGVALYESDHWSISLSIVWSEINSNFSRVSDVDLSEASLRILGIELQNLLHVTYVLCH